MTVKETIHIVGGGLVGSLASVYLAQRDFSVALHERRPDMRRVDISSGRSINLAVTSRGLKALEGVGLLSVVLNLAIPMKGRMLHDVHGDTTFVPYGQKKDEVIHSVSRGDLNKLLLDKASDYPNVRISFNERCTGYDADGSKLTFLKEESGQTIMMSAQRVIGTDGAGSVLRKAIHQHTTNFSYSEDVNAYGYKELVIPAGADGGFQMEKNALHIWPRKNYMLIALPNLDGSFTVTLFLAHQGEEKSFARLNTPADVINFFTSEFPDAAALMPDLTEVFFENPTGSMITVKCAPWHIMDKAMLLGDAAHAIVPFFGQGMNCGFEDVSAFGRLLDAGGQADWARLFDMLEAERKPNSDAIADMALENFVEMRDTVADPKFQLKKKVGFELEQRFPGKFVPRYAMVVFHPEISYADARRRSGVQDTLLDKLCTDINSIEQVDWEQATALVNALKF